MDLHSTLTLSIDFILDSHDIGPLQPIATDHYSAPLDISYINSMLGTCQIDKDNLHEQKSMECVGFGKAISNVTLEPKL